MVRVAESSLREMIPLLCSVEDYRYITKDTETPDEKVEYALQRAQRLVEQKTRRFFEKGEYTETLKLYPDGRVYPSATPVESVSDPEKTSIDGGAILGVVYASAYWWDYPYAEPRGTVTYVGGYEPDEIPEDIIRVTAEIAHIDLTSKVSLAEVPSGATSVHVGDVSFAGPRLGRSPVLSPAIRDTLREWRRRRI